MSTLSDKQLKNLIERFNKSVAYANEDNSDVMAALEELQNYRSLAELRQIMLESDIGMVLGGYSEKELGKYADITELKSIQERALLHFTHHPESKESEIVGKAIYELLALRQQCNYLEKQNGELYQSVQDERKRYDNATTGMCEEHGNFEGYCCIPCLHKLLQETKEQRDAWRADAHILNSYLVDAMRLLENYEDTPTLNKIPIKEHKALVAKYPAEPAKDADWTAEDILRREG